MDASLGARPVADSMFTAAGHAGSRIGYGRERRLSVAYGVQAPSAPVLSTTGTSSTWKVIVDIAQQRPHGRLLWVALSGAGVALAWLILSLLFGGSGAHAAETDPHPSPLGAVTDLVGSTVSTVTSTATQVVSGGGDAVGQLVGGVTSAVASVPVVGAPVSHTVAAAGTVVSAATQTVGTVATDAGHAVSATTAAVAPVVADLPLVGGVVRGLGVDDAVTSVGGTLDHTLGTVGGLVIDLGGSVAEGASGGLPPASATSPAPAAVGTVFGAASQSLSATASAVGDGVTSIARGAGSATAVVATAAVQAVRTAVPLGSSSPACSSDSLCVLGSSSAGPGAAALLAFVAVFAHRAWVRRMPAGERAPAAPLLGTDVSPD
jgi:hypothetical protein